MGFIPVHLKTLRPGEQISFDVHLKLPSEKDHYVHYFKKMDLLDRSRFDRLFEKGIRKVFIEDSDEDSYLGYLDQGLNQLEDKGVSLSEKTALTKDTLNTQAENAERALETEKGYARMSGQLGKIVDFFVSEKGALKGLLSSAGITTDVSQHSANVAGLALGIATIAGISEPKDLLDLGVACLVHDIGAKKLGIPVDVKKESLSGQELKRYLGHPAEGVAILAGKPFINSRILTLIADHEEIGEGSGFPEKKRIEKLSPISQILNLSNSFDKYCTVEKLAPKSAIDPFFSVHADHFVLEHLTILTTVITSR